MHLVHSSLPRSSVHLRAPNSQGPSRTQVLQRCLLTLWWNSRSFQQKQVVSSKITKWPWSNHHLLLKDLVLKYLKATLNHGLCFGDRLHILPKDLDQDVVISILSVYCDADFVKDKETRKSGSGYLFLLNGGQISWQNELQPTYQPLQLRLSINWH